METDPAYKQVIPYLVLRDGDRYFLMQRTRGRRRRAAARPVLDRRRRPPESRRRRPAGGLRREWARSSSPTFVPELRARRAPQRRHDRRRRGAPGGRLRRRCRRPARRDPRDRQARGLVRLDPSRSRRSSIGWRPGAGSRSTFLIGSPDGEHDTVTAEHESAAYNRRAGGPAPAEPRPANPAED